MVCPFPSSFAEISDRLDVKKNGKCIVLPLKAIPWGEGKLPLFPAEGFSRRQWRDFQEYFWKRCRMGVERAPVAKITRPVLPGNYPRNRLYRLLDEARNVPITWVFSASAGRPRLGSPDTSRRDGSAASGTRSTGGMGSGDLLLLPGAGGTEGCDAEEVAESPFSTPEFLPGLNAFTHRFFEDLFGRLGAGSVLVFDNCRRPSHPDPRSSGCSVRVVPPPERDYRDPDQPEQPPGGVAGVGQPAGPDARLAGAAPDGGGDARDRPAPAATAHSGSYSGSAPPGRRVAAGSRFSWIREGAGGKETRTLALRPHGEIFDYFGEEVYSRLGKGMKSFLLRSAFLPRMTARMAQGMTENPRAGEILSYLSRTTTSRRRIPLPSRSTSTTPSFGNFSSCARRAPFGHGKAGDPPRGGVDPPRGGQAEDAVELLRAIGDWSRLSRAILRRRRR